MSPLLVALMPTEFTTCLVTALLDRAESFAHAAKQLHFRGDQPKQLQRGVRVGQLNSKTCRQSASET